MRSKSGIRTPRPKPRTHAASTNPADLTRFDALNERGWVIPHPPVADTLLDDVGGVRSALADAEIGFYGISSNIFEYDLTQANLGKPIAVNGQGGTWNTAYQFLSVTYDASRFGLSGGQLVFNGYIIPDSLQQVNIPDVTRIGAISYHQDLADGKVQIQVGYFSAATYFVGQEVGGSLAAGVLGPQAFIPFEVGLSFPPFGTPGFNIKGDLGGGFYDRAGVQRSMPPGGGQVEARINSGVGLKFAPDDTNVLFVNELGYQKAPAVGQAATWVRFGQIYNTTEYKSFLSGRDVQNWALYLLGDRQLTSISPALPLRGLYVGASVMYAPPGQNLFTQYYELRAYEFGPFDARPEDFTSIVVSYEAYSKEGQDVLAPPAFGAFAQTVSAIGSYAFHVRPGLYVQPGIGWTSHANVSRRIQQLVRLLFGTHRLFLTEKGRRAPLHLFAGDGYAVPQPPKPHGRLASFGATIQKPLYLIIAGGGSSG